MRLFSIRAALAIACVAAVHSATTAHAGITFGSLNSIQYVDREQLASVTQTSPGNYVYTPVTAGTPITQGMQLYGELTSTVTSPNPAAPNVTGVFDLVVTRILEQNGSGGFTDVTSSGVASTYNGKVILLFTSAGNDGILGSSSNTYKLADGSTMSGLNAAPNALLNSYQGSSLIGGPGSNVDTTGTQAAGIAAASDGSFLGTFGYGGGGIATSDTNLADWGKSGVGYWASEVSYFSGKPSSSADFYVGLQSLAGNALVMASIPLQNQELAKASFLEFPVVTGTSIYQNLGSNPFTPVYSPSTAFQLVGKGGTFDNSTLNPGSPWKIGSSDPAYLDPPAPEPSSIVILGTGVLAGLSYVRRQRRAKQA